MVTSPTRTELAIPKELGEIIAAAAMALVIVPFMCLTVYFAVQNLVVLRAPICSALWLLLVGAFFWALLTSFSIRQLSLRISGIFALKEFLEAVSGEGEPTTIALGFQLFGKRFYYFRVSPKQIAEVRWSPGQASSKSGKDLADWQVALWLDRDAVGQRKSKASNQRLWLAIVLGSTPRWFVPVLLNLKTLLCLWLNAASICKRPCLQAKVRWQLYLGCLTIRLNPPAMMRRRAI